MTGATVAANVPAPALGGVVAGAYQRLNSVRPIIHPLPLNSQWTRGFRRGPRREEFEEAIGGACAGRSDKGRGGGYYYRGDLFLPLRSAFPP